jgi:AcrR family transcriptional regulator
MREIQTMFDGPMYLISPKRKRILDVMAETFETGEILSTKQLAERAGVSEKTVKRFLKDEAHGGVLQASLNYLVESNLVEIFAALIRRSKSGSQKSQELLFKTIGLLKENKPDIVNIFNFNDNRQQAIITDKTIDSILEGYTGAKGLKP